MAHNPSPITCFFSLLKKLGQQMKAHLFSNSAQEGLSKRKKQLNRPSVYSKSPEVKKWERGPNDNTTIGLGDFFYASRVTSLATSG